MSQIVNATKKLSSRIRQGDIFKEVEYLESYEEENGAFELSKIVFPLVVVLTQDCDLEQDYKNSDKIRNDKESDHDKLILSLLVAPLYNSEHFFEGTHLSEISLKMQRKTSAQKKILQNNETPRYHYLEFDKTVVIPNSVIDFKHYFSVNINNLNRFYKDKFVCSIPELFRERVSQRFANYLSRIGLPDPELEKENITCLTNTL